MFVVVRSKLRQYEPIVRFAKPYQKKRSEWGTTGIPRRILLLFFFRFLVLLNDDSDLLGSISLDNPLVKYGMLLRPLL